MTFIWNSPAQICVSRLIIVLLGCNVLNVASNHKIYMRTNVETDVRSESSHQVSPGVLQALI